MFIDNNINIAIINSGGIRKYESCLKSLKNSIDLNQTKIFRFVEKQTRGQTLNLIIKKIGTKNDLLIVADDIKFTKGWFEKLIRNKDKAEIWGSNMLYPKTNIIQDNGYEIINLNNSALLSPINRGKKFLNYSKKEWHYRDCCCGCFLYLTQKALAHQKKFYPEYGANRWDELSYILKAKDKGLKLAVLNHNLFHEGISTKNHHKMKFRTISYQIEKKLWNKFQKKFINLKLIKKKILINFDKKIIKLVENKYNKILFYGAGIFSETFIKKDILNIKNVSFCSGLKEEIGKKIGNYKIVDVKKININNFNCVVITSEESAKKIYDNNFNLSLKKKWEGNFYKIQTKKTNNLWTYSINEIRQ